MIEILTCSTRQLIGGVQVPVSRGSWGDWELQLGARLTTGNFWGERVGCELPKGVSKDVLGMLLGTSMTAACAA